MTSQSLKYIVLLIGVIGAAAGLNLAVLGLGASVETTEPVALAAGVAAPDTTTVQVVVDVPVLVPDSASTTTAAESVAPPQPASSVVAESNQTVSAAAPTTVPAPPTPPTTAGTTVRAPATTAIAATTEYHYFDFAGVASEIIIAEHPDGGLEFWSATPAPGWNYRAENESGREVEIEFRRESGGDEDEAEFKISREDGELEIDKER